MEQIKALLSLLKLNNMSDITNIGKASFSWAVERCRERTTWDGIILVAAGFSFLLIKSLATLAAYIAIVYGAWTIYKSETSGE